MYSQLRGLCKGYVRLQRVQVIANSYVDQQQEIKERGDVIAREERRLEKR